MEETAYVIILSTAGSSDEATRIAERLVTDRLVACVNVIPGLQSIYWWNGTVQKEPEVMMIMKARRDKFTKVVTAIQSMHSYDVPEIISFAIEQGSEKYLRWLENSLHS